MRIMLDTNVLISMTCFRTKGEVHGSLMLMESHASRPFNPDIARVFYRAGYIENWGRGIQKICDACAELGAPQPEYIVRGEDITLKFTALESALIDQEKVPNIRDNVREVDRDDIDVIHNS